jgi:hypothetical protein
MPFIKVGKQWRMPRAKMDKLLGIHEEKEEREGRPPRYGARGLSVLAGY